MIAPNVVLSAAHCDDDEIVNVVISKYQEDVSAGTETIKVVNRVVHPLYDAESFSYDFMLLELESASSVTPVIFDDGSCETISNNADLTVMGFGSTIGRGDSDDPGFYGYYYEDFAGYDVPFGYFDFPTTLQEAVLQYRSNEECGKAYGAEDGEICSEMLCAQGDTEDCKLCNLFCKK